MGDAEHSKQIASGIDRASFAIIEMFMLEIHYLEKFCFCRYSLTFSIGVSGLKYFLQFLDLH